MEIKPETVLRRLKVLVLITEVFTLLVAAIFIILSGMNFVTQVNKLMLAQDMLIDLALLSFDIIYLFMPVVVAWRINLIRHAIDSEDFKKFMQLNSTKWMLAAGIFCGIIPYILLGGAKLAVKTRLMQ